MDSFTLQEETLWTACFYFERKLWEEEDCWFCLLVNFGRTTVGGKKMNSFPTKHFEDCVAYTMYYWKHDAFTVGVHPIPWPPVSKPKYLPLSIKPHLLLKSLPNLSSMFLFPLTQRKRGSGRQPSLINMLGFICDNSSWHNINGQLCPSEVSLMQMRRGKQLTFERRADDSKWQGYVNYRSQ